MSPHKVKALARKGKAKELECLSGGMRRERGLPDEYVRGYKDAIADGSRSIRQFARDVDTRISPEGEDLVEAMAEMIDLLPREKMHEAIGRADESIIRVLEERVRHHERLAAPLDPEKIGYPPERFGRKRGKRVQDDDQRKWDNYARWGLHGAIIGRLKTCIGHLRGVIREEARLADVKRGRTK